MADLDAPTVVESIEGGVDVDDLGNTENLRDQQVQERLIREYLKEYEPDTKTLERVFELNSRYDARVNGEDASLRNVEWSLKKMEWDNLFNYGENNSINFDKLNGVVGVFGKNYSGKSSVIDSALYTIYNSNSKNNRKNLNIINQNKQAGSGRVEIDIDGKAYIKKSANGTDEVIEIGSASTPMVLTTKRVIDENVVVASGENILSINDVTVANGFSVEVPTGSTWVVVG